LNSFVSKFLFAVVNCGCASLGMYNPATGRREFIVIPTSDEVSMGRNIHTDIDQQYALISEGKDYDRLQTIGQRLAQVSDRQDYEYHFYLIGEEQMNAFTTPGGHIYVYAGLLDKLETDDQVASVIAHEIGHCAARHTIKKFQASMGYNLIGNLILRAIDSGSARQIAALSSSAIMSVVFSSYSRKDEYEADRLGVKYTYLAGYDPQAVAESLEILQRESKGSSMPLILKSHPHLKDRIEKAREEIVIITQHYDEES